jgi:hypothetical protein
MGTFNAIQRVREATAACEEGGLLVDGASPHGFLAAARQALRVMSSIGEAGLCETQLPAESRVGRVFSTGGLDFFGPPG